MRGSIRLPAGRRLHVEEPDRRAIALDSPSLVWATAKAQRGHRASTTSISRSWTCRRFLSRYHRHVFQEHSLPSDLHLAVRSGPAAIKKTALLPSKASSTTLGLGQTKAATTSAAHPRRQARHSSRRRGHYGIFNGRKWRQFIYPAGRSSCARPLAKTRDPLLASGRLPPIHEFGCGGTPVRGRQIRGVS